MNDLVMLTAEFYDMHPGLTPPLLSQMSPMEGFLFFNEVNFYLTNSIEGAHIAPPDFVFRYNQAFQEVLSQILQSQNARHALGAAIANKIALMV